MRRHCWRWTLAAAGLGGMFFSACVSPADLMMLTAPEEPVPAASGGKAGVMSTSASAPAPVWPAMPSSRPDPPAPPTASAALRPEIQLGPPADLETPSVSVSASPAPAAKPAEPPLLGALRCFLDKRPAEAVTRLEGYEAANQEFLMRLLPLTVRFTEGPLAGAAPDELQARVDELENVTSALKARAPLTIENMCFCRRIDTFGVYEPLSADYRFRPGDLVEVYVELRNFVSQKREHPSGRPTHVIALSSAFEIRDYAGKVVHYEVFHRKKPDESRTMRHDYFDNYRFYVPAIPPGPYTLVIRVEDLGTRPSRKARRSLDFRVTNLQGRGSPDEPAAPSRTGGDGL